MLHLDSSFYSQHTKTHAPKQGYLEGFKEFSAISNPKLSFLKIQIGQDSLLHQDDSFSIVILVQQRISSLERENTRVLSEDGM